MSSLVSKKKSVSTLAWESRKQQLELAIAALNGLSPTRISAAASFGSGTVSGGGFQITACCHVLDPSPNSPLLSSLNAFASRLPDPAEAKRAASNFQSLYKTLRPPTSLDLPPSLRPSTSLLFYEGYEKRAKGNSLCPRSSSATVISPADAVQLFAKAVVVAGHGATRTAVAHGAPAFATLTTEEKTKGVKTDAEKKKAARVEVGKKAESQTSEGLIVRTETDVAIYPGDFLLVSSAAFKSANPLLPTPPSYASSGLGAVHSFSVSAVNSVSGGLMVYPLSSPFSDNVPSKNADPKALVFLPCQLLLGCCVVRCDLSGLVPRATAFIVPVPELPPAYGLLKDLCDEDRWKADLDAGSDTLKREAEEQAVKDGVQSYLSEKAATEAAGKTLADLRLSPRLSPAEREAVWLQVGRSLRSVGGGAPLLSLWTTWTLGLMDSVLTADRCRREWRAFKPRTNLDSKAVENARVKVKEKTAALKELMANENAGEFELYRANLEVERAAKEGLEGKDFRRVLFMKLEPDPRPKKIERGEEKDKGEERDNETLNESNISDGIYEKYRNYDDEEDEDGQRQDDGRDDMRSPGDTGQEDAFLSVASLRCSAAMTDEGSAASQKFSPGGLVPAEIRTSDRVLLLPADVAAADGGGGLGQGIGPDSAALLVARAARNFGEKGKPAGKKTMSEKQYWAQVLDVEPLEGTIKVTTNPLAAKAAPSTTTKAKAANSAPFSSSQSIPLGCLWGAWVYRADDVGHGGQLWRLPSGDMYWGLKMLRELVLSQQSLAKAGRTKGEEEDEDDYSDEGSMSAREVDENMDFGSDAARSVVERSETSRANQQPALKVCLVSAVVHGLTIVWAPAGPKVTVSIAGAQSTPSEKSWRVCFSGTSNACALKNLAPGTAYRFKIETAGRRPQFATYSTAPKAPPNVLALEWIGSEAKSRSLKISLTGAPVANRLGESAGGRGVAKRTVRVEASDDGGKEWGIAGEAGNGEDALIIKSLKVGRPCLLRSRYVLSDGTVGVASDDVDVGVVPKRPGIILLSLGDVGDAPPPPLKEGGASDVVAGAGSALEPVVKGNQESGATQQVRASTVNFAAFLQQLEGLLVAAGEVVPTAQVGDEEKLPEGWRKVVQQEGGKCFYHNERNNVSSWTKPVK